MKNEMFRYPAMLAILVCGLNGPVMAGDKYTDFAVSQFKLDMILAKRGDPDAEYYVAKAYEEGHGVDKNLNKAFTWYQRAANKNQHQAQYRLGYFYEHGLGTNRDVSKAMAWYKRSSLNHDRSISEQLDRQVLSKRKLEIQHAGSDTHKTDQDIKAKQEYAHKLSQERSLRLREAQRKLDELRRKRAIRLAKIQEEQRKQEAEKRRRAHTQQQQAARPVERQRVNIPDLRALILGNEWSESGAPADYLPSKSTHCLQSGSKEIICFSDPKRRVISGTAVTYTTKSTINGFRSDGSFNIKYNFNASEFGKAPSQGVTVDPNGLNLQKGWQNPALTLTCRTTDRTNVYCLRGKIRMHFKN